jgi:hypothetical protein
LCSLIEINMIDGLERSTALFLKLHRHDHACKRFQSLSSRDY